MRILIHFINSIKVVHRKFCVLSMDLLPGTELRAVLDFEQIKNHSRKITVPQLSYDGSTINVNELKPIIKNYLLKVEKLRPFCEGSIFLNPLLIKSFEGDMPITKLKDLGIGPSNFKFVEIDLKYENWRADDLIKAIIPEGVEAMTSFSRIGHILHLNLKDHLLPYKTVIGQILMDKVVGTKAVINKAQTIENTYRNFQIELLCGVPDYQVQVKENGIAFEFDFSTVYWNPRLSSEHERLVKMLQSNDIFYDVFAGVGPFSVPAGKKKIQVLANDLNPESHKWLAHNVKKNKVSNNVHVFMKDGREFILTDLKTHLVDLIKKYDNQDYKIHIAMNLPAMAVEFLDAFVGLLKDENDLASNVPLPTIIVHVYCFVKGLSCDNKIMAQALAEANLKGHKLAGSLKDTAFVRNVAPNKDMMRVDFQLTNKILFDILERSSKRESSNEPYSDPKKPCKFSFPINFN